MTLIITRGQSNLTKSASRGAHSPNKCIGDDKSRRSLKPKLHRSRHVILHQSAKFYRIRTTSAEKNDVMPIFKMADLRHL